MWWVILLRQGYRYSRWHSLPFIGGISDSFIRWHNVIRCRLEYGEKYCWCTLLCNELWTFRRHSLMRNCDDLRNLNWHGRSQRFLFGLLLIEQACWQHVSQLLQHQILWRRIFKVGQISITQNTWWYVPIVSSWSLGNEDWRNPHSLLRIWVVKMRILYYWRMNR